MRFERALEWHGRGTSIAHPSVAKTVCMLRHIKPCHGSCMPIVECNQMSMVLCFRAAQGAPCDRMHRTFMDYDRLVIEVAWAVNVNPIIPNTIWTHAQPQIPRKILGQCKLLHVVFSALTVCVIRYPCARVPRGPTCRCRRFLRNYLCSTLPSQHCCL